MAGIAGVGNVGAGVTASRSTGSNVKETPTVKNTSSAAAVKAASPTTAVRNDTRDASSSSGPNFSVTPSASTQTSKGGIAAAANVGGGVTPSSSTQTSRSSAVEPIGDTPAWLQLQDQIDMLTPGVAHGTASKGALSRIDVPGSTQTFDDFAQNVRNGSLGMPRAAGYGLDYNPSGQIAFNPMAQDTAAMDASMAAPTGIDLAAIAHSLNGPYLARQAANGGVPPFEGPIDTAGIVHALNSPYYRRLLREGAPAAGGALPEGPVTREVQTVPIHAAEAAPAKANDWANAWASLLNGSDRLPAEALNPDAVAPAYTGDSSAIARTLNPDGTYSDPLTAIQVATNDVPLPRRDPRIGGMPITINGGSESDYGSPGLVTGTRGGPTDAPSTWDKVVDNTGKLLSHTGLGGIVSTLFPDMWNGMGDTFKSMDNGGGVKTKYPEDMAYALSRLYGDPHSGQNNGLADFIDLNHNGIDDRLEGVPAPVPGSGGGGSPLPPADLGGNQFRSNRTAVFPDMPPYRPGMDDEWNYFRDHLARGGVVGYAAGGQVALGGPDPRVLAIADAEDALHRGAADDPAVAKFSEMFGPSALAQLQEHVGAGYSMRPRQQGARQITGPGGPTDDAVPAVIDGTHPAKLSSGEVVIPVAAVAGAGDGDPRVGAERLQALSKRLAAQ